MIPHDSALDGHATSLADRLYGIAAAAGFLIVTIASIVISGRIVYRTAGMALASRFETPYSDQWDIIPVVKAWLEGTGSIALFWTPHNEHRIPLFLLLDVLDARYFHGTGQALLLVNWAMVAATIAVLALLAWRVPTLRRRDKLLGLALIVGCTCSSAQMENLAYPIGNTNIGVYLFGAVAFAGIADASRPKRRWWRWALPATSALLGTVSLVSGILIWPIAGILALALRASWRGLIGWAALSLTVIGAYLYDYASPGTLGGQAHDAGYTSRFIDFLFLYFGGPLTTLGPVQSGAAGIVMLILFAVAGCGLWLSPPGRHRAMIALAATGLFILGSGLLTTMGRVVLGVGAAQASRYTTPVLIFWSVSLILLLAIPLARTARLAPVRALRAGLPLFTLFCLMRIEPSGEWIIPAAFQIRQTGVAVALDVSDPAHEFLGGVTAERVGWYRPTLEAHNLSMFHVAKRLGLGARLFDRYGIAAPRDCLGSVDEIAPVPSPKDAVWIHGWVWDQDRRRVPDYVLFTNQAGTIVGWAETGADRPDVPPHFPSITARRLGFGGYARVSSGEAVTGLCAGRKTPPGV